MSSRIITYTWPQNGKPDKLIRIIFTKMNHQVAKDAKTGGNVESRTGRKSGFCHWLSQAFQLGCLGGLAVNL